MNRLKHSFDLPATKTDVTVRIAQRPDMPKLARLAALDTAELPEGKVLIAEQDGRPVAALALDEGGRTLADPFERTEAVVAMLRLRADQLADRGSFAGRLRRLTRSEPAAVRADSRVA